MKKVKFTQKQLTEVLGVDFTYLDGGDENSYNMDREISVSGDTDVDSGIPPTTDKIAKSLSPRYYFGQNYKSNRTIVNCDITKKCEAILNENNKELENQTFYIPDNIYEHLKGLDNQYNHQNINGIKRLRNLLNNRYISYNEMYRLKNFFTTMNKKETQGEYKLCGGKKMENWVNKELDDVTSMSRHSKEVKRNMGVDNAFIKSHGKNRIDGGIKTIRYE